MENEEVSIAEKKDVYQERAKVKQEQGDTSGAIEELTKAIQTDTLSAGIVLYNRGLTNYNSGNYKAAIADFTKAINTINANNTALASCYYLRGLSFFRTNKPKKAYDDLTTSIEFDKKGEVITARGILLAQLGRPRLAIQDFNFSVLVDKSNFNTFFNRGLAYTQINEYDSALFDFEKVIQLNTDYAPAYYMKGMIHKQRYEQDEACTFLNRALSMGYTRAKQEIEGFCD
jgi:tetratricopeptide (TPR) repeat protein